MSKFIVDVRIGGWASQIVEAASKEEAIEIAKKNPQNWGDNDFFWWIDNSGNGGYEHEKGVYPDEITILGVKEEQKSKSQSCQE